MTERRPAKRVQGIGPSPIRIVSDGAPAGSIPLGAVTVARSWVVLLMASSPVTGAS